MHYWNDANVIKRFITEYPQYKSRIRNTECTKLILMEGRISEIMKPVGEYDNVKR